MKQILVLWLAASFLSMTKPCYAVVMVGFGQSAPASCNSGTLTGGIDWITGKTNNSGTLVNATTFTGQSFTAASTGAIYSVVVFPDVSSNTIECRWGASSDLSTNYESGTATTAGSTATEVVFTTHTNTATSGNTYWIGCKGDASNTYLYKAAEDYTGGGFKWGGTSWSNLGTTETADLKFQIKVCQ